MYLCFCTLFGRLLVRVLTGIESFARESVSMGGSRLNFSPPGETSSSVSGLKSSLPASFKAVTSSGESTKE